MPLSESNTKPSVAVMGAGSVGCFFGAMLARVGFPVTLIGRPVHVDAVNQQGLLLDTKKFSEHVPMKAVSDASGVKGARLVLFCVKSTDSESAAREIAPYLEPDAVILTLQNGAESPELLRQRLPQRVIQIGRAHV